MLSTIKFAFRYFPRSHVKNLSVALLHFVIHCSVFKVHPLTTLAIRFEDLTFQSGLQIQQQLLFLYLVLRTKYDYTSRYTLGVICWWARVGSNHRPYDYQSYALAS